ncbi:amidohydrolase [Cutibacterium sp. WCA-380-WT-3A]|uniref:Amidohydrolase n=2 Tax=Cutibacterium porci TaxID=2605781 RepID=A0A7K0J9R7_9ACTN|nr:amidohydrolase [Cutibacterium porci]
MTAVIDTHAHVYPDHWLDLLEELGTDPATTRIARGLHAGDDEADISRRLAMMDAAGVRVQVLSATPQVPVLDNADDASSAARYINDAYAALVARHPDRFIAHATLPLPHVAGSLDEIARAFDELGFRSVALNTFVGADGSLADPALEPIFAELDRRRAIVYLHPAGLAAGAASIADHGLIWVNGAPMEDAIATLQLLKADVPDRHSHIRFHIAHLGGDLPFLAQRLEDNYDDWGSFARSPRESLRRMWFDAANFFTPSLRLALEVYGDGHVMMGSDFPYFQDAKYTRAVTYINDLADLSVGAEVIDNVLRRNAEQLYGELLPR